MLEGVQLASEQSSLVIPIEAICELGVVMLDAELYYDENVETQMDAEEGKNPNSECAHGNDVRTCTVCNSRDGSPNQQPKKSVSFLPDDYMLAA